MQVRAGRAVCYANWIVAIACDPPRLFAPAISRILDIVPFLPGGAMVQRLARSSFKSKNRVRFPLALPIIAVYIPIFPVYHVPVPFGVIIRRSAAGPTAAAVYKEPP